MNTDNIFKTFFAVLLSIVSFFLVMFYKKVDQIAEDISFVKTTVAVRDEQMKGLDRRVTAIETTIRDISTKKP